jgi:hypothetical protein
MNLKDISNIISQVKNDLKIIDEVYSSIDKSNMKLKDKSQLWNAIVLLKPNVLHHIYLITSINKDIKHKWIHIDDEIYKYCKDNIIDSPYASYASNDMNLEDITNTLNQIKVDVNEICNLSKMLCSF